MTTLKRTHLQICVLRCRLKLAAECFFLLNSAYARDAAEILLINYVEFCIDDCDEHLSVVERQSTKRSPYSNRRIIYIEFFK